MAAVSSAVSEAAVLSEARLAYLALMMTPDLGPKRVLGAMEHLSAPEEVFSLSPEQLEALQLPAGAAQFVADGRARRAAEDEWRRVVDAGASLLVYADEDYPERLREIYDPPPVLWVRGDVRLLARPSIAVVGTRHPTPYGAGMAEMLSRDLAARQMLIVSGMARGIDSAAHRGAMSARMPTAAIWGTGIDVIYPKENKKLAEEILAGGGVIATEQPMGTFPAPQNFPRRNRILSGLSVGVLVVEGNENSGTRVTARCALDQNRDVYAVPGNVTNKGSFTPNMLIRQGARLVATWQDVWEDLPSQVRIELEEQAEVASFASPEGDAASVDLISQLSAAEALVLNLLRQDETTQIDELIEMLEAQLTSAEVFTALLEMEMAGRVRQMPGRNYLRAM